MVLPQFIAVFVADAARRMTLWDTLRCHEIHAKVIECSLVSNSIISPKRPSRENPAITLRVYFFVSVFYILASYRPVGRIVNRVFCSLLIITDWSVCNDLV